MSWCVCLTAEAIVKKKVGINVFLFKFGSFCLNVRVLALYIWIEKSSGKIALTYLSPW